MLKQLITSFGVAFRSIRKRFFHTLLSVLGIVVGVAALVATLSLIDGLEVFAKKQIVKETSLNMINVASIPYETINNLTVKKDTFDYFTYESFKDLTASIDVPHDAYIFTTQTKAVKLADLDSTYGARLRARNEVMRVTEELKAGTFLSQENVDQKHQVAVVNEAFVQLVDSTSNAESVLGKTIITDSLRLSIIGVLGNDDVAPPTIQFPISLIPEENFKDSPAQLMLEGKEAKDVEPIKAGIEQFIETRFGAENEDFAIAGYENYAKQIAKGFLLFRLVMGMIVGLSVLVGGIGVMNVLLISVTERTQEIGVRKALGANRKSIIAQFLSESIAISIFGSILGVVFGIIFSSLAVAIIKQFADMPFGASFTINTMLIITAVAIFIGIVFGTYPAFKASRLDPVEAIRRN